MICTSQEDRYGRETPRWGTGRVASAAQDSLERATRYVVSIRDYRSFITNQAAKLKRNE